MEGRSKVFLCRLNLQDDIVHVHKDNGENEGIPFDTIDDIIKG